MYSLTVLKASNTEIAAGYAASETLARIIACLFLASGRGGQVLLGLVLLACSSISLISASVIMLCSPWVSLAVSTFPSS